MARAAVRGRLTWLVADVVSAAMENATVRTLALDVPGWPGHRAGQHVDLRLTAEDGYQAQRSYSIASAPEDARIALTVERLDDGEVSPYLVDEVTPGDGIELRGPIGGYFVWDGTDGDTRPVMLIAGGSGIVPLMAMLRHRAAVASTAPVRLLASWRSAEGAIYAEELRRLAAAGDGLEVRTTLTRSHPPGWDGEVGRVNTDMLARFAWPAQHRSRAFVCGPTGFVELVAAALVSLGYDPESVRTERFGPTGGADG
jgi:ferredoxin-NADP reductase